jgi:hypothetical protein
MKRHGAKREEADRVAAKLDESIRDMDRTMRISIERGWPRNDLIFRIV